jgi:hypothetical protein
VIDPADLSPRERADLGIDDEGRALQPVDVRLVEAEKIAAALEAFERQAPPWRPPGGWRYGVYEQTPTDPPASVAEC